MTLERLVATDSGAMFVEHDILPLFVAERRDPVEPMSLAGTGFLIAPGLLVTCWHCVSTTLDPTRGYAAVLPAPNGGFQAAFLKDIQRDQHGGDLATATVSLRPSLNLVLAEAPAHYGQDVWTYGFPLSGQWQPTAEGKRAIAVDGRYLQGYITRSFYYDHPKLGRVPSYELDMPAPAGLSGAPLVLVGTRTVIGVVYGTNDVATVEQFGSIDPATGRREPEIQRLVQFGLACFTPTLLECRGAATNGVDLAEYVRTLRQ